ncbi:hypothetical protein F5878DRAFT_707228, partial [Lentinula raphanica]
PRGYFRDPLQIIATICNRYLITYQCFLQKLHCILFFYPKYHQNYFERAGWEDTWINTAVVTAQELWTTHYHVASSSCATSSAPSDIHNAFSELDTPVVSSDQDPFDDFVSGSPTEEDPIVVDSELDVVEEPEIDPDASDTEDPDEDVVIAEGEEDEELVSLSKDGPLVSK